jgi:hypothetical protein
MAPKRKSYFKSEYEKIENIKRSKKGDAFAHCDSCDFEINLESMGKAAIDVHLKTSKHVAAVRAMTSVQTLSNFFPNKSIPTAVDEKATAAEGAWVYHVARHHHSFLPTQCVSSDGLFRTIFDDSQIAKKFASDPTKTAKIISGVLARLSVE